MKGDSGKAVFTTTPLGPVGNETALGSNFSICLLSGMTAMNDGKTILGVFPVINEGPVELLYSTMRKRKSSTQRPWQRARSHRSNVSALAVYSTLTRSATGRSQ